MYVVFDHEAKTIANNFLDNGISYLGYYRSDTDEYNGVFESDLHKFQEIIKQAHTIVGYNIIRYDIPVLERYYKLDLRNKQIIDIFKEVYNRYGLALKLDNLSSTTFNLSKIAHGTDAVRFYKEGKLDKLKEYCDMDVKLTKELYEYIRKHGYCYYTDGIGNKIKLELSFDVVESSSTAQHPLDGISLF
ncbi:MAG: hypothetical protein KatS3mg084_0055 [Candidatus Dojkabacteria bacterium]|nr:MAG: hypothetical protein KatS3mg084_0055 [Candidatus Dojkabacteria bacterium]